MEFWTAVFTLVLVLDPIGNMPVVVAAVKDIAPERRRWVVLRESLFALVALLLFFFAGPLFLELMGVGTDDVRIAGGVVLLVIALRMVFPKQGEGLVEELDGEPFLVPIAIPFFAGPSALATVILMRSGSGLGTSDWLAGSVAVLLAWSVSCLILLLAPVITRLLGPRAMRATERLMGMLLIVISVHLIMTGIAPYLRPAG
ncbi:MAG: MarC family protein [Opitutales bacterium]